MQIKRYEAKNMTMALRKVKKELGPDAVILSARSLRKGNGIFGSSKTFGVEVTAAVDGNNAKNLNRRTHPPADLTAAPVDAVQRYQHHAVRSPSRTQRDNSVTDRGPKMAQRRKFKPRAERKGAPAGILKTLHHHLLSQDIQNQIASALIEELQRIPGINGVFEPQQVRDYLRDLLAELGIRSHPVGAGTQLPKLVAFVGPPGAGKTATLAKLATRHAASGQLKVALIGMDGYRIGAVDELKTYANIIDVPLAVLNTPAALRATLKRFKKYDVVYLDTAGIGGHDQDRLDELKAALAKVKQKEIHLMLNATIDERVLMSTIERFNALPIACVGFTHLDECCTYGGLVNLLSKTKIPLSILSDGQGIPENLQSGSLEAILEWVLKDFNGPENRSLNSELTAGLSRPRQKSRPVYVANRNSDVYHEPQCKWTRKIKPANMVEFATIQEAESQRYLPCRTCRPEDVTLDQDDSYTRDRVTLTSYR